MRPEIYWIDNTSNLRLANMPRPSGGDWLDDEIDGWPTEGIDIVVSLLEAEEVRELGLSREEQLCRERGVEFVSFPIPDRGVPDSLIEASALARLLASRIGEGKAVAIHCRAGVGRASLIAACVLTCTGIAPSAAFEMIERARGLRVPDTDEQRDWVIRFGDGIMTRSGRPCWECQGYNCQKFGSLRLRPEGLTLAAERRYES